ncbi:MAG: hypothetical protein CMP95_02830 [Gammaproteobacteria bacterium]|nr:hypothetical protein [Gammaproteobacteria bacterium]|tara:strand:+ start:18803 stop:19843 length:1041 start_codon:yes stop_codon:yes gene_type:complete
MAIAYPGGNNTFVKDLDASGRLITEFSRNPDEFALNSYIQLSNVNKSAGYYLKITPEEAARVLNANLAEFVWPDGAPRPSRNNGTETFTFAGYETQRYDYDFTIGRKASEQADWNIIESHSRIKAQQAMTARTLSVHGLLQDNGSWATGHSIDVTTIPGNTGNWDQSTSARQDIKRSLAYAVEKVMLATLSVVRRKDLQLVLSPDAAHSMSESQEIVEHIKSSPDAYSQVVGEAGKWGEYQLPDRLYGIDIVVEDAVRVSSQRGATLASSFICDNDEAYLLARPGSLVAESGGPSFSTIHLFLAEDMTVWTNDNEDDRRTEGHVVDDFDVVGTAPASGFRFENILS